MFNLRAFYPIASKERPTTTVYFTAALANLIGSWGCVDRPIWRISDNVFLCHRNRIGPPSKNTGETIGDCAPIIVVLRSPDTDAQKRLLALRDYDRFYLIDDDIAAGITDHSLPISYRRKLAREWCRMIEPGLKNAARIYATSPALVDTFGPGRTRLIQPCMTNPPADLTHHGDPAFNLVFLGTRAHLADLQTIEAPLYRFLSSHRNATLTTFLGHHAPKGLRHLPNACHEPHLAWPAFRQILATRRFHVALLPWQKTAFNAARSHNKLLECAAMGAAPLLSPHVPGADLAQGANAAFHASADESWCGLLTELYWDRLKVRVCAENMQKLAEAVGAPERLRQFWFSELNLRFTADHAQKVAA